MHVPVVVLGGGPGGYAAAFLAADLGMQVALVERDERLGGTCLLRGCIPSKALLHVGRVLSEAREMEDWGIHFEKPKLDLDALRARKDKVIAALTGGLGQLARRRNVTVIQGTARFANSTTLEVAPATPGGASNRFTCSENRRDRTLRPARPRHTPERLRHERGRLARVVHDDGQHARRAVRPVERALGRDVFAP